MSAKIKLNAASGGGSVSLQAPTSTTGNANVEFKLPVADGSNGQALTTNASGQLAFATVSTAIQTTSGTDNFTIADGNLVIGTAGHGIDFSAASNASGTTSELLDDYETGTYTPSLTGQSGGSISIYSSEANLSYTKVGNIVHVHGRIRLHIVNNSMAGAARLSLPFTADSGSNSSNSGMSAVATHGVSLNASSDVGMFFETASGSAMGYLVVTRHSQAWTGATANNFGGTGATSNHYLTFQHTYQVT